MYALITSLQTTYLFNILCTSKDVGVGMHFWLMYRVLSPNAAGIFSVNRILVSY